jgi:hypothetical protein
MKGPQETSPFRKTASCPSSDTLLAFSSQKLSPESSTLVKYHLTVCEFCGAEIPLLARHTRIQKGEDKAPEIPMDLRILAESILCGRSKLSTLD